MRQPTHPGCLVLLALGARRLTCSYPLAAAAAILGLTGTASRACDFTGAMHSSVSAVCVGVGGGSLPAFLAHHYPGMQVEAVELDPVVVQAATSAMGFPDGRLLAMKGRHRCMWICNEYAAHCVACGSPGPTCACTMRREPASSRGGHGR